MLQNNRFDYRIQKLHLGKQPAGHLPVVVIRKQNVKIVILDSYNTHVHSELKVGKLLVYFHINSSILGFLRNG